MFSAFSLAYIYICIESILRIKREGTCSPQQQVFLSDDDDDDDHDDDDDDDAHLGMLRSNERAREVTTY